jgi:hypothetical protein
MADAVTQRILEQYPSFAFLMRDEEVGKLLRDAVDPNKGFSSTTFFAKLQQTKWWRSQSETQRTWAVEVATDPAEAARKRSAMGNAIRQQAAAFGTKLTTNELRFLTNSMLANGQDPSGPELQRALAGLWSFKDRGQGAAAAARSQVRALYGQFFNGMVGEDTKSQRRLLDRRALAIASGTDTLEALQERLQEQAMKRFPHMADLISRGMTPYEIIAPMRQRVAQELELGSGDQVDLSSPVWSQLLGIRDPKSKQTRLMTESEVIRLARSQDAWGNTKNGREMQYTLGQGLLRALGEVA